MGKDKEYIVDAKFDLNLTEEEKQALKKAKPVSATPSRGRQDVLVDRRDPLADHKKVQPERRKNKQDRRD